MIHSPALWRKIKCFFLASENSLRSTHVFAILRDARFKNGGVAEQNCSYKYPLSFFFGRDASGGVRARIRSPWNTRMRSTQILFDRETRTAKEMKWGGADGIAKSIVSPCPESYMAFWTHSRPGARCSRASVSVPDARIYTFNYRETRFSLFWGGGNSTDSLAWRRYFSLSKISCAHALNLFFWTRRVRGACMRKTWNTRYARHKSCLTARRERQR